ncbi:MAG: histone deacetylase [Planctomycetota bacterium]
MRLYYTDHFELPLPEGHRFPMDKYRRLRRAVVASPTHLNDPLLVPHAATDGQLVLCHDHDYVKRVALGELSRAEVRRIGFPWSPKMVERSRRSTGATLAASRAALSDGIAANLAGGTHHAFADAGEGYCVFNDAAVAIRVLQKEGHVSRACVIDCDVHQGNGTASIFQNDPSVYTFSIHGEKNFPLRKVPSDLDVELPDGTGDADYVKALEQGLWQLERVGPFDLAIYLAGADPFEEDRLGRLGLSLNGLATRDRRVIRWAAGQGLPLAVAMAGGYCPDIDKIVAIHAQTLAIASLEAQQTVREARKIN